jgi:predicted nucleotidyltransferase
MKTVAIICEYNPFTYGHIRHLKAAREETGADTVVCIMSGSFTQRGDAAILDKYQRAELAARLGADMVAELPLIYSISPADNFAYGAMKIVSSLPGIEYLSFGSECGDVNLIERTARFLENEPDDYKKILAEYQGAGNTYPKSQGAALKRYAEIHPEYADIKDVTDAPNNMLGVCYIKAAHRLNLAIKFHTVKREDNDSDTELGGEYPSAAAIRFALRREKFDEVKKYVHPYCYNYLSEIKSDGLALNDLCLFKMKSVNGYDLADYYQVDTAGGMHNRLKLAAADSVTFDEFLEKAKTKKYTMARIKRVSLVTLFDITQDMYKKAESCPPYIHVLALNKLRKDILGALRGTCDNVLMRYSDIDKVDKSLRFMIKLDFQAQGTLNLINRTQCFTKSAVIV